MEEAKARRKKLIRDLVLILFSVIIAVFLHQSQSLENLLVYISEFYFIPVAFLAGLFFASTFTVAIATSVILTMANVQNPFMIAAIGGLGAMIGDGIIFKFLREDLIADFEYLGKHFPKKITKQIIHSKLIFWFAPIVAAFMIASPVPDEIGLLMLASIKLKYRHFFVISLVLNTIGILVISLFGRVT